MKISVITATFNSEAGLSATIESFISQSYPDKELIVIDAGSNDKTLDIIREYQKHISTWISEPDKGIYDALNKGITLSKGDVIGFLHSGDRFPNLKILDRIAEKFTNHSVSAVYGDLNYVDPNNANKIIRHWKSGEYKSNLIYKGWMPPHPTLYMKKDVYTKHGIFDLSFKIAADYDLMLRVLKDTTIEVAYLPEVLVDMETGGISNGRFKNIIRKSWEDYLGLKKNGIPFPSLVLGRKNLQKIPQFFSKK